MDDWYITELVVSAEDFSRLEQNGCVEISNTFVHCECVLVYNPDQSKAVLTRYEDHQLIKL